MPPTDTQNTDTQTEAGTPTAPARPAFAAAGAALSFAGAGIAGALWWSERVGRDLPCTADGGCALVAASRWSHVDLPLLPHTPVALLGLAAYVLLLGLSMARLGTESAPLNTALRRLVWALAALGGAFSWYLQWVAHAQVHAFCPWCRASAWVLTALLALSTAEWLAARGARKGDAR